MSTAAPEKRKRCLYEVLGVSRDCSSEEIRSAYRRLALQLHPDKVSAQPGGATTPEEATAAFQELVHAYEVLSDPKERAYYDSHRTQILFSDPNSSSSWKPFNVDVFAYFSSSAYSGYGDTGRGFFKVYGDVFKRVYEQELWFSKELGLAPDAVPPAPLLGNMESPYSQVTAFYNYWLGFCTVMDFGWLDMYDSSAGPNRKSRRVMEEENKKLRKKAKREYNDSIHGLAAFAKKRDKRVIDMVMKKKAEEDKRREEEKERKKEEERKKLEQLRLYREQEWAKINEEDEEELMKDDGYVDVEGDNKNSRRKGGGSNKELFCVVCSKKFKSEKQWKNHEQSKKHRDKVAELRESFLEEEEISEGEDSAGDQLEDQFTSFDYVPEADDDDNVVDELCKELDDGFGLHEDIDNAVVTTVSDQESDGETSILEAMVSGHQNVKGRNATQNDISPTEKIHKFADSEEEGSMEYDNRKKGRRNRAKRRANKGKYDEVIMKKETTEGLPNENELHNGEDNAKNTSSSSNLVDVESNAGNHVSGKNQKAKKQQIEVKDIGRKDRDPVPKSSAKGKTNKGASKSQSNACGTCGESFESRNKLFMHLGETGHAMLKLR